MKNNTKRYHGLPEQHQNIMLLIANSPGSETNNTINISDLLSVYITNVLRVYPSYYSLLAAIGDVF